MQTASCSTKACRMPVIKLKCSDKRLPIATVTQEPSVCQSQVIPNRILNSNIEMRKTHHGTQPFFVLSQLIETLTENFNQRIKR